MKRERTRVVFSLAAALFFAFALVYGLSFLDIFTIKSVEIRDPGASIPSVREIMAPEIGKRTAEVRTGALRKEIEALPFVRSASVYRALPDSLICTVQIDVPQAFMKSSDDDFYAIYRVADNSVTEISPADWNALRGDAHFISLDGVYARDLASYGADENFILLTGLLDELFSIDTNSYTNLITEVKYAINYGGIFGGTTLVMPDLDAELRLAERVSAPRIAAAIAFIAEKQGENQVRFSGTRNLKVFDLYADSLVERN